jgi:hypothetical protein
LGDRKSLFLLKNTWTSVRRKKDRLEKLIALLAIGLVWAHQVGEWNASFKPIPWKQFKTQKRPQYSFFRYGSDVLREIIISVRVYFS